MNDYFETIFFKEYTQLRRNKEWRHLDTTTYHLFLKAFHALLTVGSIQNEATIIELAKLFFAKNAEEAVEIEQVFKQAIQERWEAIKIQVSSLSSIDESPETATIDKKPLEQPISQNDKENRTKPNSSKIETKNNTHSSSSKEEIVKKETPKKEGQLEQWYDVNLHLSEEEAQGNIKLSLQLDGNHFMLHDESIMPFSIRYLSQKSRKSFQTSHQITTDEIDIPTMVTAYAKSGLFEEVTFHKRPVNQSNIVLLSDRFGSMLSYEFLEDHLIRSFKIIPECLFEHYFFYNLPDKRFESIKQKEERNRPYYYALKNATRGGENLYSNKARWTKDTIFFIFSDAGGHSGLVNKARIKATIDLWNHLIGFSKKIYWLNPIPIKEMNDCTAKRLNLLIKMYEPDYEGFEELFKKADSVV